MDLPERFIESIITTSTSERNMYDLLARFNLKMLELASSGRLQPARVTGPIL